MDTPEHVEEAVEILQQLGLKEYEARSFVGLTRLDRDTAKQLSELTEVPRTRVYDSIRVLESKGLVEIHHSSPQKFRAVSIEEATETLRDQQGDRIDGLRDALDTVEKVDEAEEELVQQVWSMKGRDAIENRAEELMAEASDEIVLVIGDESLVTEDLVDCLAEVGNGVEVIIGAATADLQEQIQHDIPVATAFITNLEWLHGENNHETDTAVGRLLLVDRSAFLVSSIMPQSKEEQAIFGKGFGNGLVVIARRLLAQGLVSIQDPAG